MVRHNEELEKRDHDKYYLTIPDAGFSPERNKLIVENSIKKHDAFVKKKRNEKLEEYRERADATVQFLRAVDKGRDNNLQRYFGRKMIAHLRGDEILSDIRMLMSNAKKTSKV